MISVNTEITDMSVASPKEWVFYDGDCRICLGFVRRVGPLLRRRGFGLAPLQADWVMRRLGLSPGAPLTEMRVLLADGATPGGAEAVIALARRVWWAWPVALFAKIPVGAALLCYFYRRLAASRHCCNGACAMRPRPQAAAAFVKKLLSRRGRLLLKQAGFGLPQLP